MNSFQTGKILYGLEDLSEGTHSLSLKVWDVQNNSSTSYTDFCCSQERGTCTYTCFKLPESIYKLIPNFSSNIINVVPILML